MIGLNRPGRAAVQLAKWNMNLRTSGEHRQAAAIFYADRGSFSRVDNFNVVTSPLIRPPDRSPMIPIHGREHIRLGCLGALAFREGNSDDRQFAIASCVASLEGRCGICRRMMIRTTVTGHERPAQFPDLVSGSTSPQAEPAPKAR
jgi:hypothetical protein